MANKSPRTQETRDKTRNTLTGHKATNPKGRKFTKEDRIKAGENAATSKQVHKLVEGTMLDYLREAMTSPDDDGRVFYEDFINNFLTDAKKNPNGQAARMLASGLFNENTLSKLDAESNKLMARDIEFHRYRIRNTLFDKQRDLFDDRESRTTMVICSRRAGKTETNARKIVDYALVPNTPIAYIHLTHTNGVRQIFDNVLEVAGNCELGIKRSSKADGFIEFANGSSLMIFGNSNNAEAEKLRGYKYRLAIIEEAGAQRNLKYLIDDILSPLLKDYADSQLLLTGTPPRNKAHYSHILWSMPGIKKYHWTLLDNPYIPNRENIIKEECEKRGISEDDPFIRREFMGDMDAFDIDSQVYRGYKTYKELPNDFHPTRVYIGVDYGFVDSNAIVPLLVDEDKKVAYTFGVKKFNKASVTEIANNLIEAREKAIQECVKRNAQFDVGKVQVICDTNEKSISYEMTTTYGIKNVFGAYKYHKQEAISQLAEWLRNGTIFIEEDGDLAFECENTMYKRDDNDTILADIDDDIFHPDAMDALLYASRMFAFDVMRMAS